MPSWAPWDNSPPPPYGRDRLAPDSLWLSTAARSPLHRSLVLQSGEHSEQFTPIDHDLRALGLGAPRSGADGLAPGPAPACSARPWRRATARSRARSSGSSAGVIVSTPTAATGTSMAAAIGDGSRSAGEVGPGTSVTSSAASSDGRSRSASARAVARARSASTIDPHGAGEHQRPHLGRDRDEARAGAPGELTDRGRAVDLLEHPEAEVAERDRVGGDLAGALQHRLEALDRGHDRRPLAGDPAGRLEHGRRPGPRAAPATAA